MAAAESQGDELPEDVDELKLARVEDIELVRSDPPTALEQKSEGGNDIPEVQGTELPSAIAIELEICSP